MTENDDPLRGQMDPHWHTGASPAESRDAMNLIAEKCEVCGGFNEPAVRTHHHREGDDTVTYLHYLSRCSQCGREVEDERLRSLNEAAAAKALAVFRSKPT